MTIKVNFVEIKCVRLVQTSVLLRNHIKVIGFQTRPLSADSLGDGCAVVFFFGISSRFFGSKPGLFTVSLIDRWAVVSYFGISLGSLGSKPSLFADSLVDGWAVIFFFGISSRTRPLY